MVKSDDDLCRWNLSLGKKKKNSVRSHFKKSFHLVCFKGIHLIVIAIQTKLTS